MNEQGIKDFKGLVKELQKAKNMTANKNIVAKVVLAEISRNKPQKPELFKTSHWPNTKKQSVEHLNQIENELEQTAPVNHSQTK